MIGCRDVSRLLGSFLALELAPETEGAVRAHLATCARCRAAVEAADPAAGFALRLAQLPGEEDEAFVAGVLGGIRQRRAARAVRRRYRTWAAVAALLVGVLGAYVGLRGGRKTPDAAVLAEASAAADAPFVEVEGDGVTVYQFAAGDDEAVQVALIVDPGLVL